MSQLQPSTRELVNQWLRALTILTEPGPATAPERMELIRQVNQPATFNVTIATPISNQDAQALRQSAEDMNLLRSRETGAHALVTGLLLKWLSEAEGTTQGQIITRLALTIDTMLAPDG